MRVLVPIRTCSKFVEARFGDENCRHGDVGEWPLFARDDGKEVCLALKLEA